MSDKFKQMIGFGIDKTGIVADTKAKPIFDILWLSRSLISAMEILNSCWERFIILFKVLLCAFKEPLSGILNRIIQDSTTISIICPKFWQKKKNYKSYASYKSY
jgi:hypothetical protein